MPTIAKGEAGEQTTRSVSTRCVLGLSFNVLSRSHEIEHSCQCQPNQRSRPDQVAGIESANVERVERQQRCYCKDAKAHNEPIHDSHVANRVARCEKEQHAEHES